MTEPPKSTSASKEEFNPGKLAEIVRRLKREGRFPPLKRLNEILQKHRPEYQQQVQKLRQQDGSDN